MSARIPTLDITRFDTDRDAFVAELGAAYREWGFAGIRNHGIPQAQIDEAYATFKAFFALPEGQRGIFVGGGASVRTARLMGVARMTDMMLTGRSVDAATAERWNLVQYVVPEGQALDLAVTLAAKAAAMDQFSVCVICIAIRFEIS